MTDTPEHPGAKALREHQKMLQFIAGEPCHGEADEKTMANVLDYLVRSARAALPAPPQGGEGAP